MSYRETKVQELRELIKQNMYASKIAQQAGNYELAKQYWQIATAYSDQLVKLQISKKSSLQLMREDREADNAFRQLYAESVELFV